MATTPDFSRILTTLNAAGIQTKQPALYQTIKSLIQYGQQHTESVAATFVTLSDSIDNSLTFGTAAERAVYKPQTSAGNIVLFYETDTSFLYIYNFGTRSWVVIGAPTNATYLTVNNELTQLPNSRRVLSGAGIAFDDTTPGVRTISSTVVPTSTFVLGFVINDGSTNTNAGPYLVAPVAGNIGKGKLVVKAVGPANLQFDIYKNGVSVFGSVQTILSTATPGTLSTLVCVVVVAANDIFNIAIIAGSSGWQFSVQLES